MICSKNNASKQFAPTAHRKEGFSEGKKDVKTTQMCFCYVEMTTFNTPFDSHCSTRHYPRRKGQTYVPLEVLQDGRESLDDGGCNNV